MKGKMKETQREREREREKDREKEKQINLERKKKEDIHRYIQKGIHGEVMTVVGNCQNTKFKHGKLHLKLTLCQAQELVKTYIQKHLKTDRQTDKQTNYEILTK